MESFRKAYGALKDSTKVGLANFNSEFKDLDIAIVKATNHDECPPKERHVSKIFAAMSISRSRADVAYCIHALSRRLAKTRNWIVAIKVLIVVHRTLREGDPTSKEELVLYSRSGRLFQISSFRDDSSSQAWDCSAWVRTYGLYLEERFECLRTLHYDIEAQRVSKLAPGVSKTSSTTRLLSAGELLEQLPVLQQLLYRLICCQPEGAACHNFLIQYALALVLKESFKIYCSINDGIINLVDLFFEMPKHDAVRALNIYRKSGKQAERLADIYGFCRTLDLARTFQFPTLKQPPPTFLATMEEYIKEAPQIGSLSNKRLEYQETEDEPEKQEPPPPEEETEKQVESKENTVDIQESQIEIQSPVTVPLAEEPIDLLGLNEVSQEAIKLDEINSLALAILQPGNDPPSTNNALAEIGNTSGWELAIVTAPSNSNKPQVAQTQMAGGFDKLLLDSLYEDNAARRTLQLHSAGYNASQGCDLAPIPYNQQEFDPFAMSNNIPPAINVQMATLSQQQEQMMIQQQQQQQPMMRMVTGYNPFAAPQHMPQLASSDSFGNPFYYPQTAIPPSHRNNTAMLL